MALEWFDYFMLQNAICVFFMIHCENKKKGFPTVPREEPFGRWSMN